MEIDFKTEYDIDEDLVLIDINGIRVRHEDTITALEYCIITNPQFKIDGESITYGCMEVHGDTLAQSAVQLIALTSTFTYTEVIHNISISAHHYNTGVRIDKVFEYDSNYHIKDILPPKEFIQNIQNTIEGKNS